MPRTLWCYTFASLGLIGIPPMSGFVSKWYLAQGALSAQAGVFRYLGPAVLLVSALLTAGYLLPVTIDGFLPGKSWKGEKGKLEPPLGMLLPLGVLAALTILLGLFPNPLASYISELASTLL